MVMVCFSAIIKCKPPWAYGSRASRYKRRRANTGGLPSKVLVAAGVAAGSLLYLAARLSRPKRAAA
jgi:hypothetical protein